MITDEMMDMALSKMRDEINSYIIPRAKELNDAFNKIASPERLYFMRECMKRYKIPESGSNLWLYHNHYRNLSFGITPDVGITFCDYSVRNIAENKAELFVKRSSTDRNPCFWIGVKSHYDYSSSTFPRMKYDVMMLCKQRIDNAKMMFGEVEKELPRFASEFEKWYNSIAEEDAKRTEEFNRMFGVVANPKKIHIEVNVTNVD